MIFLVVAQKLRLQMVDKEPPIENICYIPLKADVTIPLKNRIQELHTLFD